jgi:hypothetical protein
MLKRKQIIIAATMLAATMSGVNAYATNELTSSAATVTQNFDSMWSNDAAQLTMPEGWRVERNLTAPRVVGSWDAATTEVMYAGGTSLASNAKNGTWNFGNSADQSDRAVGGLSTTVSNGTRCVNVMTCLHNSETSLIINGLNISYNVEKYRKGANTAGFAVQLYYSTDGTSWQSAGNSFTTSFDPDDATIGDEVVPISTTTISNKDLRVHVEGGKDLYLAWNISVASGSTPDKAMGLAVDDISLTASFTDNDDSWTEPETPTTNPSGIYLRGLAGWDALSDYEFSDEGDGTYVLYDKVVSGTFKVGDASWSATCNYGSNGTNIIANSPYVMTKGINSENISCGSNAYTCKRVVLTIADGEGTLLLETNDDPTGLTTVYMYGDFNGWNYMDKSGALNLDETDGLFKGRVSLTAGADGYAHWMIYQTVGMGGAWGAANGVDQTGDNQNGTLEKKSTAKMSVASGTYDVTFNLTTGEYTMVRVSAAAREMTLNPANTVLVKKIPDTVKVLSLNNSLIYYNDQDVMFNEIAKGMGKDATWTKHTLLGKSLATHWEEGDGLADDGTPGAKMMVRSDVWSHIILQEQSSLPRTNLETFRANVTRWVEYIREYCPNPNAIIILPVNWAYNSDWENFSSYNNTFVSNYLDVARELGVVVCPVARAYEAVYETEGTTGANTWFLDDRHPTAKATYMAACMEYATIYGVDPLTITTHSSEITDAEAAAMRQYASDAIKGFENCVDNIAGKINFSAKILDDFGMEMSTEGLTFSIDGGGTINEAGQYVSDGTLGTFNVTATNGQFTNTATITVAEPVTVMEVYPAININTDNLSATENFDSMGDEATATLPEAWRIDRQTSAPRTVGTYAAADTQTMYSGGVSLASNAKNGTWNFGATNSTDRAVGGITTGIANGSRCVNVYTHLYNNGKKTLENVKVNYNVEKYRKGNNAAGFTVQLYYSIDGRTWKSAGSDFTTSFDADDATIGYDDVPGETVAVSGILPETFGKGCDLYLAWNISVTSGDNAAGAPAIGIDDFAFEAQIPAVPAYDYHIYVEDNTEWAALGAYAYGDSELWGAWPGQAPIDEQTIDGTLYKVFGHNNANGSFNLIFNNWNNNKQLADYPFVGGRDYYFVITADSVKEKEVGGVESVTVDAPAIVVTQSSVSCSGSQQIALYGVNGQLIDSATDTISTASLSRGVYIVAANGEFGTVTAKIVK